MLGDIPILRSRPWLGAVSWHRAQCLTAVLKRLLGEPGVAVEHEFPSRRSCTATGPRARPRGGVAPRDWLRGVRPERTALRDERIDVVDCGALLRGVDLGAHGLELIEHPLFVGREWASGVAAGENVDGVQ